MPKFWRWDKKKQEMEQIDDIEGDLKEDEQMKVTMNPDEQVIIEKRKKNEKDEVIAIQQETIEDLRSKLEIVAEREFERQKEDLAREGIDVSNITEPEQLEQAKAELRARKTGRADSATSASGSVGLTSAQLTGRNEKGYSSYAEMLQDLRRREKSQNEEISREATQILNELFRKARTTKGLPTEPRTREEKEGYLKPTVGKRFYKIRKKRRNE